MSMALYGSLDRAVKVLLNHPELAPVITVSQTDEALWVTPYVLGSPIRALLTWHDVMTDTERELEPVRGDAGDYCKITVRGLLDGIPVSATSVTFQDLGTPGRATLEDLRAAAENEMDLPAPQPA